MAITNRIKMIVALSRNAVIGQAGKIPWKLSGDMKRFKELTTGHMVVMGRRTYDSIGRPLPNRTNLVLTRGTTEGWMKPALWVSPKDPVKATMEWYQNLHGTTEKPVDLWIIGGAEIYKLFQGYYTDIYMTHVHMDVEGIDRVFYRPTPLMLKNQNFSTETGAFMDPTDNEPGYHYETWSLK
jgi:dihydrofolate reductase